MFDAMADHRLPYALWLLLLAGAALAYTLAFRIARKLAITPDLITHAPSPGTAETSPRLA